jgi:predicted transposase/invertase (TIGR01784 family)
VKIDSPKELDEIMGLLPIDADILPPSDDRVFKLLMTSPEAELGLMELISGVIGRSVVGVTIHNNELPPGDTEEKAERFDVNCKIDDGSQINLEMQASHMQEDRDGEHRNLKGKSIYYLTDLHSSQPSKGTMRYDRLARSYQITFCSYTVYPDSPDYVNSFSMRHDTTGELFSDALHVVYVELSKLEEIIEKPVNDMSILEKWSVFFQYAPDPMYREAINKVIASEEVLTVAGNLLMNISQNENERAIYRSRKKFQTDYQSDLATSWDNGEIEGIAKGIVIGKAEGREEGREEGIMDTARKLYKLGVSYEIISLSTGMDETKLRGILQ